MIAPVLTELAFHSTQVVGYPHFFIADTMPIIQS